MDIQNIFQIPEIVLRICRTGAATAFKNEEAHKEKQNAVWGPELKSLSVVREQNPAGPWGEAKNHVKLPLKIVFVECMRMFSIFCAFYSLLM